MGGVLEVRRACPPCDVLRFRVLRRPLERLRGLLGTDGRARPVALVNCHSIHTFGMRYRIDVAFVTLEGLVTEAWCSVPPGRLLGSKGAWVTLERPHERRRWLAQGERVFMTRVGDEEVFSGSVARGGEGDEGQPMAGREGRGKGGAR